MLPQEAFREILLNAVVHKDYSACNPIQISVYEDKIYIWNDGEMPSELDSTEKLFEKHSSKPYNPKLANVFFKSGMIEAWGRGFDKIKEACAKYDGYLPEYNISAFGIMVLCTACDKYLELLDSGNDLPLGHFDQDNDQVVMTKIGVTEGISMTEQFIVKSLSQIYGGLSMYPLWSVYIVSVKKSRIKEL